MENANLEYLLKIFRELTTEMPDQMIYREDGDSIELKCAGSITDTPVMSLIDTGWNLIGNNISEAA